jgi:hypothetical protein
MSALKFLKRVALGFVAVLFVLAALFALGVVWPEREPQAVRKERPLAIVGVTVLDLAPTADASAAGGGSGNLVTGQTVLIQGDRISAVAGDGTMAIPENAVVVDGRGRYLLPALWDMHAHVYAVSPLLDLPLYIAYGVTNLRDMQGCPQPNDPFIACAEDKRRWTQEAIAGQRVAPRVVSTTSFMANGPGIRKRLKNVPEFFETSTPDEARAFVRHFARSVEAIKVYDRIPREAYLALADEAQRVGLPLVGHRPHAVSAVEAAQHQQSIEHARFILQEAWPGAAALREVAGMPDWREDRRRMLDEHDPAMAEEIFAAMKTNGTWYVPTHLTRWADAYADDARVREDEWLRYLHPLCAGNGSRMSMRR